MKNDINKYNNQYDFNGPARQRQDADKQIYQNRKIIKSMQERLFISEYQTKLKKKLQQRQQSQLQKQLEYEQVQKSQQFFNEQRQKSKKQKFIEKQILSSQYDNMIRQRQRRKQQQNKKKMEEQRLIKEKHNMVDITQKMKEKQKAQQYKRQAERQVELKKLKDEMQKKKFYNEEKNHRQSIEQRINRQKQEEQNQRKYYKKFHQIQNSRLRRSLNLNEDSLSQKISQLQFLKNNNTTRNTEFDQLKRQKQSDDFFSYRDYLRRIQADKYRVGLDLQIKQKTHKKVLEKIGNFDKIGRPQNLDQQVERLQIENPMRYNPITNPIPFQRRNPNVLKQILNPLY